MCTSVKILALVLCFSLSLVAGCGSSNTTQSNNSSSLAQVQGDWKIVLSENQAEVIGVRHSVSMPIDSNPTQIAISLQQSNGILDTAKPVYAGNTGCEARDGDWWYLTGPYNNGWEYGTYAFDFDSGLVSGNTVTISLKEGRSFHAGQPPDGQIKLLGTFQANGSIKGTVTDGCVLDGNGNPTSQTFTATRMSTFPPVVWP